MSCSLWAWTEKKCGGDFCPGDCDFCSKAYEDEEDEDYKSVYEKLYEVMKANGEL